MSFLNMLKDYLLQDKGNSFINDIPVNVISEKSRSLPVSVTSKRVENGFNITDTTRKEQQIINITVVDNSSQYLINRENLEKLLEKGELVTFYFNHRDVYENMVIENIEEIESKDQKNGFTFYITLRQVLVVELSESDVKVDYKKTGSSGGAKTRNTAKIKSPTTAEVKKVNEVDSTILNRASDSIF
ncbi:MAG: hypothetical protein SOY60_06970 [Fusobacterium gastrosuis]|uniref:phage baseplate protein n=1 Tax=Fusobacterium gastrosuis TaxID=1755100 RepID=UPI002A8D0091|nr:hypothetical protein [Fusobacterium gastrosuis]